MMAKNDTKSTKSKRNSRITGQMLIDFMFQNGLPQMEMTRLFGISVLTLNNIYGAPGEYINEPVVCYLYRQYTAHPELIGKDKVDIKQFYDAIGGKDAISGSDFSLIMGRELSAYVRWFDGGKPSASVAVLIKNAMKLNDEDARAAFDAIRELCRVESLSRGIDVLSQRDWRDPDSERPAKSGGKKKRG